MDDRTPHPKNVPGPFYVLDGCCTTCMVPHSVVPALMGFDEQEGHCFVRKQPESDEELYQAIQAVRVAELACLRYGGKDPGIVRRLVEVGEGSACDHPEITDAVPVLRNHVTFEAADCASPQDAAALLREYLASTEPRLAVTRMRERKGRASLSLSWYAGHFYTVWFGEGEPGTGRWLAYHSPIERSWSRGLSFLMAEWPRDDPAVHSIRWYTVAEWNGSRKQWQETPY